MHGINLQKNILNHLIILHFERQLNNENTKECKSLFKM